MAQVQKLSIHTLSLAKLFGRNPYRQLPSTPFNIHSQAAFSSFSGCAVLVSVTCALFDAFTRSMSHPSIWLFQ